MHLIDEQHNHGGFRRSWSGKAASSEGSETVTSAHKTKHSVLPRALSLLDELRGSWKIGALVAWQWPELFLKFMQGNKVLWEGLFSFLSSGHVHLRSTKLFFRIVYTFGLRAKETSNARDFLFCASVNRSTEDWDAQVAEFAVEGVCCHHGPFLLHWWQPEHSSTCIPARWHTYAPLWFAPSPLQIFHEGQAAQVLSHICIPQLDIVHSACCLRYHFLLGLDAGCSHHEHEENPQLLCHFHVSCALQHCPQILSCRSTSSQYFTSLTWIYHLTEDNMHSPTALLNEVSQNRIGVFMNTGQASIVFSHKLAWNKMQNTSSEKTYQLKSVVQSFEFDQGCNSPA